MVSIPASLIATFIGISLMGYTLNLMSLLGLSLVVGILVDDAIVVLENIHRHMEMGKNKVRAAYDGAAEIGFTVTAITLVIVVVFLPIAMSTGLVSNIITQFCIYGCYSYFTFIISFVYNCTLVVSRFGKLEHLNQQSIFGKIIIGFERYLDQFTHQVTNILKWALNHKKTTLAIMVVAFFGSTIGLLGGGFIEVSFCSNR